MKIKVVSFLSVASILISVTAFCLSCFNVKGDASILVSALAVLCTVLIGWQIFSIIDLNKIDKRFSELKADVESKITQSYKITDGFHGLALREVALLYETLYRHDNTHPIIFLYGQLSVMLSEAKIYTLIGQTEQMNRLCVDVESVIELGVSLPSDLQDSLYSSLQELLIKARTQSSICDLKFADALERFAYLYSSLCNRSHRNV